MKSRLPSFLLAFVALPFVTSCAGVQARETVLMPVMAKTWPLYVAPFVERAAAADLDAAHAAELRTKSVAMQAALDSGIRYNVSRADWDDLRLAALDGIQIRVNAGEFGPGVGMSAVEHVRQFDVRVVQLLGR